MEDPRPAVGAGARRFTLAALVASCLVGSPAARGTTFTSILGTPLTQPIGEALARSIGRSLPVTAASPGVSFTFDRETGAFERDTDVLGQLFLERPRPLGRGKVNLSLDYQWVSIDTVDGQDLGSLHDTRFPLIGSQGGRPLTIPRFGIGLDTQEVTTSVTYGVTDDLDLNFTVPIVYSHFTLDTVVRDFNSGQVRSGHTSSSKLGIGDLFLRAKYRAVRGRWGDVAAGLVLRAPAGNEENFQGSGAWELSPMLYGATPSLPVGGRVALQAYANAGLDLDAGDVDRSEGRFGAGLDCRLADVATFSVALLGREPFQGLGRPGFLDKEHFVPGTRRAFAAPLFGLERDRASIYDVSIGGRVNLWRDTVFGFANAILPITRAGFRSDVIPTVGVEVAF